MTLSLPGFQAFDFAGNSAPFRVGVSIELVNDNEPVLLLNGLDREVNYSVKYFERQPYLNNLVAIMVSREPTVEDLDVGPQYMVEASVSILNGE